MLILPDRELEQPVVVAVVLADSVAAADYCNAADKIAFVILQPDSDPKILHDTILAVAAVVVALVEEDVEMLQQFVAVVVAVVDPEEQGAKIQYEVAAAPNYLG